MTRENPDAASPSVAASPSDYWAIERAIVSQIHRFAQANDAHDHDALAEMFTLEGSFARPTAPEAPVSGREAIRAFFRDRPARRTRHVMANIVVDLLSPAHASARSYVVLYTGERGENVLVGDFDDELRLELDGIWRFSRRSGSLAFDY
ncbi:nuclear transport factor 2 family protein [Novosphingobium sp.]|uniref:nuclear transport factor 2 family protein n=1 Tax=Novosphingobium sp. TaxID=1874826 RepID=UPI00391848AB